MSDKAKTVGKRIKMMRINKSLQQNTVAEKIGISQAHLSNIESGRCNVTLENLIKLHEVLDCPMRDFFIELDAVYDKPKEESYFSLGDLAMALASLKK